MNLKKNHIIIALVALAAVITILVVQVLQTPSDSINESVGATAITDETNE